MKILNSPYFPRLFADFETEQTMDSAGVIVLVQEFISGQSLFQLIKLKGKRNGLEEDNCKYLFRQIAEAVRYMHS